MDYECCVIPQFISLCQKKKSVRPRMANLIKFTPVRGFFFSLERSCLLRRLPRASFFYWILSLLRVLFSLLPLLPVKYVANRSGFAASILFSVPKKKH